MRKNRVVILIAYHSYVDLIFTELKLLTLDEE